MKRLTDDQFAHRKGKVARRAELMERGLWNVFVKRREELKAAGMDAVEAWDVAYTEALNGSVPSVVVMSEDELVVEEKVRESGAPDFSAEGRVDVTVFGDRSCSITRTVEWVAKQMMVDTPNPEDAPSPESWSMLAWARRSNQNEAQFWGQIWSKMMPSKQQLEAAERLSDDGSDVLLLIDRVRQISEGSMSAEKTPLS
jgi:hypothetical protein